MKANTIFKNKGLTYERVKRQKQWEVHLPSLYIISLGIIIIKYSAEPFWSVCLSVCLTVQWQTDNIRALTF